ncbi:MAG: beta-mannosidase, partial [Bacteroidota bacterium]|nr:beta-mannosidase [Bacteroidota bacterium]
MKKNVCSLWCLLLMLGSAYSQTPFVSVANGRFHREGHPYYFVGTNYWYGGLLALGKNPVMGIERLRNELDFLKIHGIKNVRVLAGSEGEGLINGVPRVGPALQTSRGVFDPTFLKGLDALLNELDKRKMTAVIYLSNNWNWSGGFLQYLKWNHQIPDSAFSRPVPWSTTGKYTSQFYGCASCVSDYLNQVHYVVTHVNTINHKKYTEEPSIMAWEIANEPRPMSPEANGAYLKFISRAAAYLKKLDPNHLVTTGTEGYMSTGSLDLYKQIHAIPQIDYLTIHIWPKN